MPNLMAGMITGLATAGGGFAASAIGEGSAVTVGLAISGGMLVFYVTREFTKLRTEVNALKRLEEHRQEVDQQMRQLPCASGDCTVKNGQRQK